VPADGSEVLAHGLGAHAELVESVRDHGGVEILLDKLAQLKRGSQIGAPVGQVGFRQVHSNKDRRIEWARSSGGASLFRFSDFQTAEKGSGRNHDPQALRVEPAGRGSQDGWSADAPTGCRMDHEYDGHQETLVDVSAHHVIKGVLG
jgi:hypothetical protein